MGDMTRRGFMAGMGATTLLGAADGQRPNVLFLAIDDLNDWVGCLGGHPDVKTPHIDRLAQRGMLFTRAYCAAPVCNPSRAALMSGLRPSTTGVYENQQPPRRAPLLKDAVMMPQHFTANGYRVVGGGKIYHNSFNDEASWQEFFKEQKGRGPKAQRPATVPASGIPNKAHFDWGPLDCDDEDMGDWAVADWAAGELNRRQDRPLFLACGFIKPHLPWYVPRKYFDMYPEDRIKLPDVKEDDLDDVPSEGRRLALRSGDHKAVMQHGQWRKAVQGYLASITFADRCVGRVLDALDASPLAKNTIVVLWSDHGWHLGEKLHWRKFALWEEATRNLFLVAAPGVTKAGTRCQRTVDAMDLYPTMVDLCGLSPKPGLEGMSLRPLLRNAEAKWDRPAVTTYERGNHTVRSERWRYIRYHDGGEELYDHSKDELEWTNVAGRPEHAKVKAELAKWLPKVNAEDSPKVQAGRE